MQQVADEITATGGVAEAAELDALNLIAIERHLDVVIAKAGVPDIVLNAVSIRGNLQGTPLVEMSLEDFTAPVFDGHHDAFPDGHRGGAAHGPTRLGRYPDAVVIRC